MFNNISWASYWSALTVTAVLYYVYVLRTHFREVIFQRLKFKRVAAAAGSSKKFSSVTINDEDPGAVQSLIHEISASLDNAAKVKAERSEIIFGLQQIVKKYPGIKATDYQSAITQLIISESEEKCAVHLSGEEARRVWVE
jgi:hypothetical protein